MMSYRRLTHALMFLISIVLSQSALAVNCDTTQSKSYVTRYENALLNEDYLAAAQNLEALIVCQPNRGDLRIELLRLYLLQERWADVQMTYDWLNNAGVPEGARQIVESWITSSQSNAYTRPAYDDWSFEWAVLQGFNSNPTFAPDSEVVSVWSDTSSGSLRLTEDTIQKASSYTGLGIRAKKQLVNSRLNLNAELQLNKYYAAGLNTFDLSFSAIKDTECSIIGGCQLALGGQHFEAEDKVAGLWMAMTKPSADSASTIRVANFARNSVDRWLTTSLTHVKKLSDSRWVVSFENEKTLTQRESGDRYRIGLAFDTKLSPPIVAAFSLTKEWDEKPYANALWANTKRDLKSANISVSYDLSNSVGLNLEVRRTYSEIPIFDQTGWNASIEYRF